jgi:hypothetical protein
MIQKTGHNGKYHYDSVTALTILQNEGSLQGSRMSGSSETYTNYNSWIAQIRVEISTNQDTELIQTGRWFLESTT